MASQPREPRVSIISPIWNVAKYIEETMRSVQAQTYQDWELLLMDGGSTDGTKEIVEKYAAKDSRIKFRSERDEGPWDATDKGLDRARGEFISILGGQDGLLDPSWLAQCIKTFDSDPAVSLVWGSTREMKEDGTMGEEMHVTYSHLMKKESAVDSLKNIFWKAWRIFADLIVGDKTRKKILLQKIFSRTAGMRVSFLTSRSFPDGKPPQKEAWLSYWLKTGFIFPDQAMCVSKNVYLACAPRYPKGSRMVNHMTDFNFEFNAKGYLAYHLPILATFGRMHPGGSGDRVAGELYRESEKYLERIVDFRKRLAREHTNFTFVGRDGKPIGSIQF